MAVFSLKSENLTPIKEMRFQKEREIQKLVEHNLQSLLGLEFVRSEFPVSGNVQQLRIDSLAYDPKNRSFVIIEYKQDKNFSVVDQGYAYLSAMLNNKADFILEYNECCHKTLKKSDVDWSQSRVIFIAQNFTSYQKEAINFKDLPISLWEIKRFGNQTVCFEEIRKLNATESIKTVSHTDSTSIVDREIKVYTEADHLKDVPENIAELYGQLRDKILELDDVGIKATKLYVAFTINDSNFVTITIQRKALKLWMNAAQGKLDDPCHLARDVSKIGHHGTGNYELTIADDTNFDAIMLLIRQAYRQRM